MVPRKKRRKNCHLPSSSFTERTILTYTPNGLKKINQPVNLSLRSTTSMFFQNSTLSGERIQTTWVTLTFRVASDATTALTQKREGGRSACHELVAMVDASPKILKTLGLEERFSRVQKK